MLRKQHRAVGHPCGERKPQRQACFFAIAPPQTGQTGLTDSLVRFSGLPLNHLVLGIRLTSGQC
jgi:hypothetical protein